jgi:hypothetical protein
LTEVKTVDAITKLHARLVYAGLFLISLAIPFLHYTFACDAMRTTRRINMGLTAGPFLVVNGFGEASTIVSALLLLLILISWKEDRVLRSDVLCGVAVSMLFFATAYGMYCCGLLSWVTTDYVRILCEESR